MRRAGNIESQPLAYGPHHERTLNATAGDPGQSASRAHGQSFGPLGQSIGPEHWVRALGQSIGPEHWARAHRALGPAPPVSTCALVTLSCEGVTPWSAP